MISRTRERGIVLLAFGMLLPVLAGGNVFVRIDPHDGLYAFVLVALASVGLVARTGVSRRPDAPALLFLVVLLAWQTGQVVFREVGPRAASEAIGLALAALSFVLFSWKPAGEDEIRGFVRGLALGVLVTAAYGQYQYWIMYPRVTPILRAEGLDPIVSINANFYNANCYAPFVAATTLLTGALWTRGEAGLRAFAVAAIAAFLATLVLTGSRATVALLAVAAAGLVVFGRGAPGRRAAIVAALVAALAVAARIGTDWISLEDLWRYGTLGRVDIWQGSWAMIRDHWALGVGPGRFADFFYEYRVTEYYTRYPHNVWLEVFAETGIVGAASLAGFWLAGFASAARGSFGARGNGLRRVSFVAAALLAVHALVDIDWHAPANPILQFTLLGFCATPPSENQT